MKTAMELIADDVAKLEASSNDDLGEQMLELVAQRAREEMREAAYYAAIEAAADGLYDESAKNATHRVCVAIKKLPATP